MKKKLFAIVLVCTVILTQWSPVTARVLRDETVPYEGGYILAINGSANITSKKSTGPLTEEDTITEPAAEQLYLNEAKGALSGEVTDVVADPEDGSIRYQVDPRDQIRQMKAEPQDVLTDFSASQQSAVLNATVGGRQTFRVSNFLTNRLVSKTFVLKSMGTYSAVWVEEGSKVAISTSQCNEIAAKFDRQIYPAITSHFGPRYDRNNDGKTAILLFDIQDGWNGTSQTAYTAGYFSPNDLEGYNNNMDMVYLDTYPTMGKDKNTPDALECINTLAHEYTHLVIHSDYLMNHRQAELPTWINEGLAMAAEHMLFGAQTNRINYYNYDPYDSIKNGHSVAYWDQNGDTLANYALSYLFFQYMRVQTKQFTGGGEDIFKQIIQNNNRGPTVVSDVMGKFYSNMNIIELIADFRMATLLCEEDSLYGFRGESYFASFSPNLFTGSSASLRGGGVVIKKISHPFTPRNPGRDIQFLGFRQIIKLSPPQILPEGKIYGDEVRVKMWNDVSAAKIYYTIDGSIPSRSNGKLYTGPFILTEHAQVRAIAICDGYDDSNIATQYYSVYPTPEAPTVNIEYDVSTDTVIYLSCKTPGAEIYYYTTEDRNWKRYTGRGIRAYTLDNNGDGSSTLIAEARSHGLKSFYAIFSYYISGPIETPQFDTKGGIVPTGTVVKITASDEHLKIFYTLDGSTLSATNGILYDAEAGITIEEDVTIKAVSCLRDSFYSGVAVGQYRVAEEEDPKSPYSIQLISGRFSTKSMEASLSLHTNLDEAVQGTLLVAAYTADDEMLGFWRQPVSIPAGADKQLIAFTCPVAAIAQKVKVFLWKDDGSCMPLFRSTQFDI